MEAIGWEIKPAGWTVILILLILIAHHLLVWLRNPSDRSQ
jgi:hypothetical protein